MFQKRHYEFLARFIRREVELAQDNDPDRASTILSLARLLASELAHDNAKFDRAKWLDAIE